MKIIVWDNLNLNALKKSALEPNRMLIIKKTENAYGVVIWTSGYLIT